MLQKKTTNTTTSKLKPTQSQLTTSNQKGKEPVNLQKKFNDTSFLDDFHLIHHLKNNISQKQSFSCEIHDSNMTFYCFQCQFSICEVCSMTSHSNHCFVNKDDIRKRTSTIENEFKSIDERIKEIENQVQPKEMLKIQKEGIEKEMDDVIEKMKDLKERRIKEIHVFFESQVIDFSKMKGYIGKMKESLRSFILKNKSFYYNEEKTSEDEDNFLFLQSFDLENELKRINYQYLSIMSDINENFKNMNQVSTSKYTDMLKLVDSLLIDMKRKEIKANNCKYMLGTSESNVSRTSIDRKDRRKSSVKYNEQTVTLPFQGNQNLIDLYERLNEDKYSLLRQKIESYSGFNDTFRSQIYDSLLKNSSFREIEDLLRIYDERLSKRINMSNVPRKITLNKSNAAKSKAMMSSSGRDFSNSRTGSKGMNVFTRQKSRSSKSSVSSVDKKKKRNSVLVDNPIQIEIEENIGNESDKEKSIDDMIDKKNKKNKNEDEDDRREGEILLMTEKNKKKERNFTEDEECEDKINVDYNLNKHIEDNRSLVYKSIEKVFRPINKSKLTPIKSINPKRREMNSPKSGVKKYKINMELKERLEMSDKISKDYDCKEKINLSNPLVRRYFSYAFIDYLRGITSSQEEGGVNDLSLFDFHEKPKKVKEEGEYSNENVNVKLIEGSDEIHFYLKNKKKIEKHKVSFENIASNTSQTSQIPKSFYIGCRFLLHQNKIYITGGKDSNGDKRTCFVYNIQEKKLIKIASLKFPRSFHCLAYNDSLKSIVALGGEYNNTCEIFDFYLNQWTDIPDLNYPRSNITFITNTKGTLAYAMFGVIGEVVNKKLSDVIEVIDLIDMNKGWYKFDYSNKTGVDLKTKELIIYLVSNDKVLIYGGVEVRTNNTLYLVLDLTTLEMNKVCDKVAEEMKIECEKSMMNKV